jgi:hypothetical protein
MVSIGLVTMAARLVSAQVQPGNGNVSLELSGQLNRALLIASDGDTTKLYNVDNDSSSSRFRIVGMYKSHQSFTVGAHFEAQFESNSTASVNQNNRITDGGDFFGLRTAEIWFDTPFGVLSLGQGAMASDGSAEADLAGSSSLVAYSSVADIAAGILFFDDALNGLTAITVGDTFLNLDGLGRNDRVRYDTPIFGPGLRLSASFTTEDIYDFALNFASDKIWGLKIAAAIAYAKSDDFDARVSGSISLLHDSGFNVTFAAGLDDVDNDPADPNYWYIKVGYTQKLMPYGQTSIVIDFYRGEETQDVSDEAKSVGVGFVQNVDAIATEFYLGLRNYDLDRDNTDLNHVFAVLTGARVKF